MKTVGVTLSLVLPLLTACSGVRLVPVHESQGALLNKPQAEVANQVIEQYWERCVGDAPFFMFAHPLFHDIPGDLSRWGPVLKQINTTAVQAIVREVLSNARRAFPTSGETVVCTLAGNPDNPALIRALNGVGGLSPGGNRVLLQLHPQQGWEQHLAYVAAHEYHHSAWFKRFHDRRRPWTLLQWMVHEGRADHFAERVSGTDIRKWWTRSLTPSAEQTAWKQMKPLLHSSHFVNSGKYMFGNGQDIPWLAGYEIGYKIVGAYLANNPGVSIEHWSAMSADDLYRQSGYNPSDPPKT